MTMFRIIRSHQTKTSEWSGGTTTQLAIWPEGADYAARDFTWRVSTAKVDLPESDFTRLPGVRRWLMILDGRLEVFHRGHHSALLERFDVDEFMGDWETTSRGRVTDFNVMVTDGDAELSVMHIAPGEDLAVPCGPAGGRAYVSRVLYPLADVMVEYGGETVSVEQGGVVVCTDAADEAGGEVRLRNRSGVVAVVVCALIRHN